MPRFTRRVEAQPALVRADGVENSTRKPRLTWIWPLSSSHGTRNMKIRSGSPIRSRTLCWMYSGCFSRGDERFHDLFHSLWNSGSAGFLATRRSMNPTTYWLTLMRSSFCPGGCEGAPKAGILSSHLLALCKGEDLHKHKPARDVPQFTEPS